MKKGWMLALIALSMISCQKGEQASKELPPSRFSVNPNEPSYKLQDEQGVITWYVNFDWYIPPTGSGVVSQKILTDTNTRLRVIRGNDDTLNQMIASGEMPDIVTVGTWTSFPKIAHRWAMPLNQLADAYDPYFYQVAKRDTLAWYTDDQGNIYGYPASSNDYEDFLGEDSVLNGGPTFLVRQDIYRAIGSPDMRTPEGFLQALRDAKTYDPTIMPLVFGIESTFSESIIEMLASFLAIPTLQDGKHYERIFDAEYLRWIEVLRQAHQEGLILDDNFTYNKIEYNDGFNGGQYFAVFASTLNAIKYQLINNHNRNPNQHYLAIDGPANRNLDAPHLTASGIGGWALTFITQGSQNKERAIQLLTYLMSEEGHFTS
ncbi:extracellular solute-binding protein, partial [Spirochaetales bacterium BR151]